MGAFVSDVSLRWSDMDAFGHVNHAQVVTLLEEGRAGLLFDEAVKQGIGGMAAGMVVARLAVDFHAPLTYSHSPVQVSLSVRELRAASFIVDHALRARQAGEVDGVAQVTAEILVVPYDLETGRPRRLTTAERDFLAQWQLPAQAHDAVGEAVDEMPREETGRA